MNRILPLFVGALALLLVAPIPGEAQSLVTSGGFGIPVSALDARSRGMGSLGVGQFGGQVLPADPAAAAGLQLPTISATLQPMRSSVDFDGTVTQSSGSRFPLLSIGYPIGQRTVATVTLGSYLDQQWNAQAERTIMLAGEEVRVLDQFASDGGLSGVRVGFARLLGNQFAVGLTGGMYTGQLTRAFIRRFETLSVGANVQPFSTSTEWQMQAPTVAAGARWDFQELVRVSGSVTWAGSLEMNNTTDDSEAVRTMELPTEFRLGASAILSPRLSLSGGVGYADWTDAAAGLEEGGTAGAVWNYGGGLEWAGPSYASRDFPIRVGYHRTELPFQFDGNDPVESVVAGGFGINFAQVGNVPLARLDVSVERGTRDAGTFSESFWRSTFSLRLSGR